MGQTFRIYALSCLFTGFIAFAFLNGLFGFVKDTGSLENRAMAPKPVFDPALLDPFPPAYEAYYNDHFSLRNRVVKYFHDYNMEVYKKSPSPTVIIGNNGWLFLSGGEMDTYLGTRRLTIEQMEQWRLDLECQKKFLEARGCKFYFAITPSKANIHSENIPDMYYQQNQQSWGEQLMEYLQKHSDISVISLYDPFKELGKKEQIYYKLDNHWNHKGAFYAANIISTRIAEDFPAVKPLSISDYSVTEKPRNEGDIYRLIGNPESFSDVDYEFVSKKSQKAVQADNVQYTINTDVRPAIYVRDTKDPKKPNVVMIGDSYSIDFFPFFAENFGRSANVFDNWRYWLYEDIIAQEKPDVYLLLMFEPWIKSPPNSYARLGCGSQPAKQEPKK